MDSKVDSKQRTKSRALSALDGMREIVRAEMIAPGIYVSEDVVNPRRVKSICGGRKFCAVGSLWVAGGVRLQSDNYGYPALPGISEVERDTFLRRRPGLRLAYESINRAAQAFADREGFDLDEARAYHAPIEQLFEQFYGDRYETRRRVYARLRRQIKGRSLTRRDLLTVIAAAKRLVKAT